MVTHETPTDQRAAKLREALEDADVNAAPDEITFETPWQARAFALVTTLYGTKDEDWAAFHRKFVDRLADTDTQSMQDTVEETYYEKWVACLVSLAVEQDILTEDELDRRTAEFKSGERDLSVFEVTDPSLDQG